MPAPAAPLARALGFTVLALGCACSSPGLPSTSKPHASARPRTSAAPAPAASFVAPPTPPPPEPLPDGCATAIPGGLTPVLRLEAVGRACASGMRPIAPSPRVATLEAGAAFTVPFRITDPSRCLRAAAAGSTGVEELELEVVVGDGRVLGADRLPGPLALANPDGPICPTDAAEYRAVARVTRGRGEVALQVWQAD